MQALLQDEEDCRCSSNPRGRNASAETLTFMGKRYCGSVALGLPAPCRFCKIVPGGRLRRRDPRIFALAAKHPPFDRSGLGLRNDGAWSWRLAQSGPERAYYETFAQITQAYAVTDVELLLWYQTVQPPPPVVGALVAT
jgi:hypothetical protein